MSANFEKLNSDEKISILMKLSSKEIIYVCQVNKNLNKICKDTRYDSLWIQRIKRDFKVEYKGLNAYDEYKRLFLLYNTKYYLLKVYDQQGSFSFLFNDIESVIKYVRKNIEDADTEEDLITIERLRDAFRDEEEYMNEFLRYTVIETTLTNPNTI